GRVCRRRNEPRLRSTGEVLRPAPRPRSGRADADDRRPSFHGLNGKPLRIHPFELEPKTGSGAVRRDRTAPGFRRAVKELVLDSRVVMEVFDMPDRLQGARDVEVKTRGAVR